MVSRIQNEMEVALPLVDVFRFPTIRALAKYIDVLALGAAAAKDENLVLLKPVNRSAPHLFFIHDVSGQVDGYIGLCRYLKTGLNCWGLRADRLENHTPVDVNVKDIAAKYIQKIKIVQPSGNGPYYIAGWSLGGSIAIEIARQLEKENEKIAFLGLIDSEAPSPLRGAANRLAPAKFRLGTERRFLMNIFLGDRKVEEKAREIKTLDRLWPEIADLLETGGFDKWAVKRKLRNFGGHVLPDNPRLKVRDYIDYLNRARTLAKAVRGYCLAGKIKAPLYLFKASQSLSVKAKQWKKYLSTPLKLDEIEGSHVSILRSPRVARLAESFDHRLREA